MSVLNCICVTTTGAIVYVVDGAYGRGMGRVVQPQAGPVQSIALSPVWHL